MFTQVNYIRLFADSRTKTVASPNCKRPLNSPFQWVGCVRFLRLSFPLAFSNVPATGKCFQKSRLCAISHKHTTMQPTTAAGKTWGCRDLLRICQRRMSFTTVSIGSRPTSGRCSASLPPFCSKRTLSPLANRLAALTVLDKSTCTRPSAGKSNRCR
jgi:hypothetical protein